MEAYSYDSLLEIITFLASENNQTVPEFISNINERIVERKKNLSSMASDILAMPSYDRAFIFSRLGLDKHEDMELAAEEESGSDNMEDMETADSAELSGRYPLKDLIHYDVKTLAKTKPAEILINDTNFDVTSWSDVSMSFVEYLISEGKLTKEKLPFCPNKSSRKAYVNFFAGQPFGVNNSGLFKKIADDFYVDIKHNAKYHLLNIWWSLGALNLENEYKVELLF